MKNITILAAVNFLIFQWFFIRLGRIVEDNGTHVGWTLFKWPVPLTGWWSPYKFWW